MEFISRSFIVDCCSLHSIPIDPMYPVDLEPIAIHQTDLKPICLSLFLSLLILTPPWQQWVLKALRQNQNMKHLLCLWYAPFAMGEEMEFWKRHRSWMYTVKGWASGGCGYGSGCYLIIAQCSTGHRRWLWQRQCRRNEHLKDCGLEWDRKWFEGI